MVKIRTYKMTQATGFAPNFDGGVLTLATCKPGIREKAEVGEWIAGFTSSRLTAGGTKQGEEKLIYLAQITEKITFNQYWKQFPNKRPNKSEPYGLGDNIYTFDPEGYEFVKMTPEAKEKFKKKYNRDCPAYVQINNGDHICGDMLRDLSSDKVLISQNFKFFGKKHPLDVTRFKKDIRIPLYPAPFGYGTEGKKVQEFIDFVMSQKANPDIDYSE